MARHMINDAELRALFQAESDEHLQSLDEGLLRLEADAGDSDTLQRIFRDAHSLKGSARMLGIMPVEQVAHRFEDVLGAARRGEVPLTPAVVNRLYETLDTIRALVGEAVTGVSARINLSVVLARLDDLDRLGSDGSDDDSESAPEPSPSEDLAPEAPIQEPTPPQDAERANSDESSRGGTGAGSSTDASETLPARAATPLAPISDAPEPATAATARQGDAFRVETVRVDSRKLDDLMLRAGELVVTGGRIEQRARDVADVSDRWAELYRGIVASEATALSPGATSTRADTRAAQARTRMREIADGIERRIAHLKQDTHDDRTRLDNVVSRIEEGIRSASLLPLSTVFGLFPRLVRDLGVAQSKELSLEIQGGDTTVDKGIIERLKDPLMHLIRNAADHGIEPPDERQAADKARAGTIVLRASQSAATVTVEVIDDGRGIDSHAVGSKAVERGIVAAEDLALMSDEQVNMLVFAAGFSTSAVITDLSGRGVGLDVVRSAVDDLRGSVAIETTPGEGSVFRIDVPVTLATSRVLVTQVAGIWAAFPMDCVSRVRLVSHDDISLIESQGTLDIEGEVLPLAPLWRLLELEPTEGANRSVTQRPCVIVRVGEQAFGAFVDAIDGIQEVLLTTRESLLKRVRNVAGSTILPTGEVCFVLNAMDLLATMHGRARRGATALPLPADMLPEAAAKPTILIVEDSITTRTQIARVLTSAGYEVVVSVDGVDALQKLESLDVDAIVWTLSIGRCRTRPQCDGIRTLSRKVASWFGSPRRWLPPSTRSRVCSPTACSNTPRCS